LIILFLIKDQLSLFVDTMNQKNQQVIPSAEPFLFPGDQIGCLLVHGFTGSPKEMRLLGEYIHSRGHTVLGIRLSGHATKPEDMIRSHWKDWLLSVEDGLHLLRDHCQKIVILGLSMGGMLSQIAAARFPVNGLVMMSTPYQLPDDWRLKFIHIFKYIVPAVDKGKDDWNDPANAVGHISYPQYPSASVEELLKVIHEMHATAPDVQAPVLLVQSTGDATVPVEHVQWHFDDLGSEEKEIFIVNDCGHIVTRDSERERVFEKVTQFINKIAEHR
jgi:carboxylesterase